MQETPEKLAPVSFQRNTGKTYRLLLVFVVFLFAALVAEPLLWEPLCAKYYASQLETDDSEKAKSLMLRLHEMGPAGNQAVEALLDNPAPWMRRQAVVYLYRYQSEQSEALLLDALRDGEHMVWTMAEGALYGLWAKSDNEQADHDYRFGIQLQMAGKWNQAISWFRQAFQEDPSFVECIHQIGHSYEQMGQYREAIGAYLETIELKPSHFSALARLHALYEHLGNRELAAHFEARTEAIFPHWSKS